MSCMLGRPSVMALAGGRDDEHMCSDRCGCGFGCGAIRVRTSLAEQLCQKCLKDGRGQVVVLAQSAVTLLIDQVQVTRIHAWHMAC